MKSRHLLTGWFVPPTPGTRQPIIWASNNTICWLTASAAST
ncbi:MAG: hypothetical protein U0528_14920 [Anaerolineae bacterium]